MFEFKGKTHRSGRAQATRLIAWLLSLSVLTGVAGVVSRANISRKNLAITLHNKAFYLSATDADFIRPGLVVKIESAAIDASGIITTKFKLTDPKGLPLDRTGLTTPGAVSTSFIAATIKAGDSQYTAYTTRVQTSPITKQTATQAGTDANGTYQQVADGEYTYTFKTPAPKGYDVTATHTIGVYASRDLQTDFSLGTQYDNDEFSFVPNGSPVTVVRDVVRTESCDRCHDPLSAHGGARRETQLCILCHQPQTTDPDTGNTVDFKVMIHKIHMGSSLPSVKAGKPYQIIGFNQSVNDWSTVVFPADVRRCEMCHVVPGATASLQPAAATDDTAAQAATDDAAAAAGAAQQNNYLTKPSAAACGACHDDVNFASGKNHPGGPQPDDKLCAGCHIPQGELEFDASIKGAHVLPNHSSQLPGTTFKIMGVTNTGPGQNPTVTFSLTDAKGNPILPSDMTRLRLMMSLSPTTDYSAAPAAGQEDATSAQGSNGVYTYTFKKAIPADATGTHAVGIEGYRNIILNKDLTTQMTGRDIGVNQVFYFGVTDAKPVPRRTVLSTDNCNVCHGFLDVAHGGTRNNVEYCPICHNASATDSAGRPAAKQPAESIHFKSMIHKVHRGENLTTDFTIYGGSGNPANFNDVRFPGDLRDCAKCHLNGSEQLPLPDSELPSQQPRGWFTPQQPATTACLACHTEKSAAAHAVLNASPQLGEACEVCHGQDADFSINKVHAR